MTKPKEKVFTFLVFFISGLAFVILSSWLSSKVVTSEHQHEMEKLEWEAKAVEVVRKACDKGRGEISYKYNFWKCQ